MPDADFCEFGRPLKAPAAVSGGDVQRLPLRPAPQAAPGRMPRRVSGACDQGDEAGQVGQGRGFDHGGRQGAPMGCEVFVTFRAASAAIEGARALDPRRKAGP